MKLRKAHLELVARLNREREQARRQIRRRHRRLSRRERAVAFLLGFGIGVLLMLILIPPK